MRKAFQTFYVLVIAAVCVGLVYLHRESAFGNDPTSIDLLLVAVAAALLIFPAVKEVTLGGVTIKAEFDSVKKDISEKLLQLKNEIVSTVAVSPTFNVGNAPLDDDALRRLESILERTVNRAFEEVAEKSDPPVPTLEVADDAKALFAARYNIERELRRLWGSRNAKDSRWPTTAHYMARSLAESDVIPRDFVGVIKDVYNICSPAIHGEDVSPQQSLLVRDLAPRIVATLRSLG